MLLLYASLGRHAVPPLPTCALHKVPNACFEGNTLKSVNTLSFDDCCAACTRRLPSCTHFTLNIANAPSACRLKSGVAGRATTSANCTSGASTLPPPPPAPPAPAPPVPPPRPPLPDAPRPNLLFILADDLGFYDTAVYNPNSPTPTLKALSDGGVLLDHHYVFRYCSPTRRSFLSGRLPVRITTVQPGGGNLCSDFLPLSLTLLPAKLKTAKYSTHYIGKGHEGYETTDHLPINRGFDSHVGFLTGSESYYGGCNNAEDTTCSLAPANETKTCTGTPPDGCAHDMWHDHGPGTDIVGSDTFLYSADFFATTAVNIIDAHAVKVAKAALREDDDEETESLFMYLPYQNVHYPYQLPPAWQVRSFPSFNPSNTSQRHTYANMLALLDEGIKNVTEALKRGALWENTLIVFSADNGGINNGWGNNYPLRGHKHDPYEGGVRAVAFLAGGFVPPTIRGTTSGAKLIHVADWYALELISKPEHNTRTYTHTPR